MPKKNTSHLENELKNSTSLDIFLEEHQEELTHCSLSEQLVTMLESKGLTKAEVVKESNLNEVYAYQILSTCVIIFLVCLMFMKGVKGENRFGKDPLGE